MPHFLTHLLTPHRLVVDPPCATQAKFEAEVAWAVAELRRKGTFDSDCKAPDEGSVLGLLQTAQKTHNLTDAEVIEEVLTIGGAGHETTANTLSWCLLLLAQNPDVQSKLWPEVDAKVIGEVPTFDEARDLDYCRAVVYETLRLYPTVALFTRMAARDCKLDGYDVPAGSTVVVTQHVLNRNPEWYPEPLRFNPDRFVRVSLCLVLSLFWVLSLSSVALLLLSVDFYRARSLFFPPSLYFGLDWVYVTPQNLLLFIRFIAHHDPHVSLPVGAPKDGPRFAFLPFGAGARTCIGQRLAVLEAIQLLGSIAKHFKIELPKGEQQPVSEHLSITLRPIGLRLRLVPRA